MIYFRNDYSTGAHPAVLEALVLLGERYGVELPICRAVHRILYCGADPMAELRTLLDRDLTREFGES